MIKAIIFDFDGVIIESAEIKTDAFRTLFAGYPDMLPEIIAHHQKNSGISRYKKFRYIYEKILGQELSAQKEAELGEEFSRIVLEKVLNAPYTPGAMGFLQRNEDRYHLFIASGTPQVELQDIIAHRQLTQYFREIHGVPTLKDEIIGDVLNRYSFAKSEAVFVGDAESDRVAAEKAGVSFIARITSENPELQGCLWKINDLTGLETVLNQLSHGHKKGG
jgi:phosphoglycolate phosphatase-like HAD superfamily hydrolase